MIVFKVINYVFLIVISEVVNRVPYIVHLLVLNPGRAVKKITLEVERVNKVIGYGVNLI